MKGGKAAWARSQAGAADLPSAASVCFQEREAGESGAWRDSLVDMPKDAGTRASGAQSECSWGAGSPNFVSFTLVIMKMSESLKTLDR